MNMRELMQVAEDFTNALSATKMPVLREALDRRLLFHATRETSLISILSMDELSGKTDDVARGVAKGGVSLTRSYQFAAQFRRRGVILVLDATHLLTKPVDYWNRQNPVEKNRPNEMEEWHAGPITGLHRHLISIDSKKSPTEIARETLEFLKEIEKWQPPAQIKALRSYIRRGFKANFPLWNAWKPVGEPIPK